MTDVFLISEDVLKTETILNDNVGGEYLDQAITTAQEINLQQLIGTSLLNDLCNKVKNGTLNDNDKMLLDEYITPFLKFQVLSELTIPISFKYRNAGLVQTNNEYVSNTIMKDAQAVASFYEQRANFFAIRLSDWLCHNSTKFPAYKSISGGVGPDKEAYNTQIYLG